MNKSQTIIPCLAAVATLLIMSCAGIEVREKALTPAMRIAYVSISVDVERGISASLELGVMTVTTAGSLRAESTKLADALAGTNRYAVIAIDWPGLRLMALRGIDDRLSTGELGPNGAESFRERIRNFDAAWRLLGSR